VTTTRAVVSTLVGAVAVIGLVLATADPFTLVFYVAYTGVALVLLTRQPTNLVAWLLFGIGLAFLTTTTPGLDIESLQDGTADGITWLRAWISSWGGVLSYVGVFLLAAVFPSGRLPAGRWGTFVLWVTIVSCIGVGLRAVAPTFIVNPEGIREYTLANPFAVAPDAMIWTRLPSDLTTVTLVPVVVAVAAAGVSLIVRYRRATGVLRLQLRWVVAAMTLLVGGFLFGLASSAVFGDPGGADWAWIPVIVAFPMVPVAIGIAVTRYRLFEIDRLISRTIGYGLVTVALFGLFAVVNLGTQTVLAPFVRGDTVAVAISTLVVAATFSPLRARLQRLVDHRFNRTRYDHERTLATFADGLRQDLDVDRLFAHIRGSIDAAVEPRSITVWRRDGGEARPRAFVRSRTRRE
jgi:hypothetical protein